MACKPAVAPSYTAFAICNKPPVQSPQAYNPFILVSIFSFTTILSFFVIAPNFLANSVLPATPCATKTPLVFSLVPSSNFIFSTLCSPEIS